MIFSYSNLDQKKPPRKTNRKINDLNDYKLTLSQSVRDSLISMTIKTKCMVNVNPIMTIHCRGKTFHCTEFVLNVEQLLK